MTATKPAIPENIKLNILSKWIDWTEKAHDNPEIIIPKFKFIIELVNGDERMTTEFSGGIANFSNFEDFLKKNPLFRERYRNNNGSWWGLGKVVRGLYHGTRYYYRRQPACDAVIAVNMIHAISLPKLDNVLYCLMNDGDCGDMSFNEFCDTLGYDNDSISHLNIYNSCMKIGKDFRRVMGKDMETVRLALEDY